MKQLPVLYFYCIFSISIAYAQNTPQENSKQFDVNNPFSLTISTSFSQFIEQYDTEQFIAAKVKFTNKADSIVEKKAKLRVRGIYRKRNCEMPPIKIKFADKQYGVDLFDELGAVKLVNYCELEDINEQYLVKEYLCYKMYEILTDYSFKTYFLKVDFINTDSIEDKFTNYAFLIEDIDDLAKRHNSVVIKTQHLSHSDLNLYYEGLLTLFYYLIGNSDFYLSNQHNLKLIREDGQLKSEPIPIPYDFDFSGMVNAHYAKSKKELRTKAVKDQIYYGLCRSEAELAELTQLFIDNQMQIIDLVNSTSLLNESSKNEMLEYIHEFYTVITNEKLVKKKLARKCWK